MAETRTDRGDQQETPPVESHAVDPFTGTRPVGPIQTGGLGRGGWPFAAKMLIFLLLALGALVLISWAF